MGVGGFIPPWCWEVDLLNSSQSWKEEMANMAPALPVLRPRPRAQGVGMTRFFSGGAQGKQKDNPGLPDCYYPGQIKYRYLTPSAVTSLLNVQGLLFPLLFQFNFPLFSFIFTAQPNCSILLS